MASKPTRIALLTAVLAFAGCSKKPEDGAEKPAEGQASATGAQVEGQAAAPGDAVARVNGVAIPRAEFDAKYNKMTRAFTTRNKDIPENLARRYKESILKQLVERELLKQKIESEKISIDAPELDKEFEEYKKMFRTEENFQRYLKSSDVTVDAIKDNITHNIAVNKLLEKSGNLAVTEAESREYYDKNQKRYEIKEQVRASHILLKLDAKADKKTEAEVAKKSADIHKEVMKKDADFAALAKKHSEGPTASRGGDLSYFPRGRMVPEFEEVAFKMKAGEISKPIKTQFGYHIIKMVDHKEGRQRPFEEVRESIDKLLKNKKTRQAKQELLKGLRTDAKVESLLPDTPLTDKAEPEAPEGLEAGDKGDEKGEPAEGAAALPTGNDAPPAPAAGSAPAATH